MADGVTLAQTTVSISAGVPATYDSTGFGALTFTDIGSLTQVPPGGGATFADITVKLVSSGVVEHYKGTKDQTAKDMEVVIDRSDAGQIIVATAFASFDYFAFKVLYNNGDIDYYQGRVVGYTPTGGDPDQVRLASISVMPHPSGVVEVAA